MLAFDRDALICDLAETYHILDYKALPVETLAVLASGLGDKSRIKRKLSGMDIDLDRFLLAGIFDSLSILVWMKTKDGAHNRNRPESMLGLIMGADKKEHSEIEAFDSIEDLESYYRSTIGWNN